MKHLSRISAKALAISLALVGASAWAQSTWNWGESPGCDPTTCTVGGVRATVSAWYANGSTSTFGSGTVRDVDPSGLGVTSRTSGGTWEGTSSPHHAMDNMGGTGGGASYAELLGIAFTNSTTNAAVGVNLTQVAAAWTYSDSDAMIFRWDGAAAAPSVGSYDPSDLPTSVGASANGWTMVANGQFQNSCSDGTCGTITNAANTLDNPDKYSSYWLVSTALGGTNDAFKVKTFSASICTYVVTNGGGCAPPPPPGGETPEPGTLALALASVVGGWTIRRRRTAGTAAEAS